MCIRDSTGTNLPAVSDGNNNVTTLRSICSPVPASDTLSAAGSFATTCSIPSTGLAIGSYLEIHAHGVYTTTATASPTFAIAINAGGTTGACPAAGTVTLAVSITNGYWDATCYIQIQTLGNPGTADAYGTYASASNAGNSPVFKNFTNAAAVNYITTSAQTVTIRMPVAFVSGQTFTMLSLTVRTAF